MNIKPSFIFTPIIKKAPFDSIYFDAVVSSTHLHHKLVSRFIVVVVDFFSDVFKPLFMQVFVKIFLKLVLDETSLLHLSFHDQVSCLPNFLLTSLLTKSPFQELVKLLMVLYNISDDFLKLVLSSEMHKSLNSRFKNF